MMPIVNASFTCLLNAVCIGGMFGFVDYNGLFASQQQLFMGIDSRNHSIFALSKIRN